MTDTWTPFGLDAKAEANYRVLVDGVPSWLKTSLTDWVVTQLAVEDYSYQSYVPNAAVLRINRELRINLPTQPGSANASKTALRSAFPAMGDKLLMVVDWIVSLTEPEDEQVQLLNVMLAQSSSKWQAGMRGSHPGLVARVAEGVQDAAEELIAQGGTPGKLLADAWQKVHRLEPDDSGAYADAVRAVEVASFDALGIDNSKGKARLGQAIAMIRKDETWRPPFERENPHHPVNQTLVGMLRTLWVGHRDRHGKADYTNVTHAEAEAAVTLAVTLVGWFTSGAVKQRPQPEQFDG